MLNASRGGSSIFSRGGGGGADFQKKSKIVLTFFRSTKSIF